MEAKLIVPIMNDSTGEVWSIQTSTITTGKSDVVLRWKARHLDVTQTSEVTGMLNCMFASECGEILAMRSMFTLQKASVHVMAI
jgi:hypothetical protein